MHLRLAILFSDENIFIRGLAVTMEALDFEITGFVSQKDIDANISSLNN